MTPPPDSEAPAPDDTWKRCNICKTPIAYEAPYYVCNVSTCNRKRTGLSFCSVSCWDAHLEYTNHRESWAVEAKAPTRAQAAAEARKEHEKARGSTRRSPPAPAVRESGEPRRTVVRRPGAARPVGQQSLATADDVLIIASRLKALIKAESGFNTSDRVLAPLSEIVRRVCREAIRNAERAERRTVLDRDIPDVEI